VGGGGGLGATRRAGLYQDDEVLLLRVGFGLGRRLAVDIGLAADTNRIEAGIRTGLRFRPFQGNRYWSPYIRGELGIVSADHLASNLDWVVGFGHWGRINRWLAWWVELDQVVRTGDYDTLSSRIEAGLSVTMPSFWK
jgi:hypothetical protein